MSGYETAWVVILSMGLVGAFALSRLLANFRFRFLKWLVVVMTLTIFIVPAPVPNHAPQWAPAFVVAIFEAFFQIDGQPQASLRILLLSILVMTLMTTFVYFIYSKFRPKASQAPEDETSRQSVVDEAPNPSEPNDELKQKRQEPELN